MQKILVVDDNLDNRTIIGEMLKLSGFRVVSASDGAQAVAVAERERPNLILMDLSMPVMDGWSATERIRATADLSSTPVIAVTGHVTQIELERAMRVGCDDYLTKPIDYETMLRKVRALLA
jgi:CheY-like chemotaxis protein